MMKDYLHTLNYEFNESEIESLNTYFKYAEEYVQRKAGKTGTK